MSLIAAGRFASAAEIARVALRASPAEHITLDGDALSVWFSDNSAAFIRGLAHTVLGIGAPKGVALPQSTSVAGFYFTALALTVRRLLSRESCSNPTWFHQRTNMPPRYSPSRAGILRVLDESIETLKTKLQSRPFDLRPSFYTGDSRHLPVRSSSVDAVISSPPYCTRLDYPVATQPELALLGWHRRSAAFRSLRDRSLGTPTVSPDAVAVLSAWGPTCVSLLQKIAAHRSRASGSYYRKTYAQYFAGLYDSLREIKRVSRPAARCVLVVQSSWYKDVNVDLLCLRGQPLCLGGRGTRSAALCAPFRGFPSRCRERPLCRLASLAAHRPLAEAAEGRQPHTDGICLKAAR